MAPPSINEEQEPGFTPERGVKLLLESLPITTRAILEGMAKAMP
jgi:hypothetical protein